MEPVRDDAKTVDAPQLHDGNAADYLVFEIEACRYALPVAVVREVLPALEVDPVPGDTADLLGVITLRGRMVPVADVRRRLGLPPRPIGLRDHFLVTEDAGRTLVVPCDRVLGLSTLTSEETGADDLMIDGARIAGVVRDQHGLVLVPDLQGPSKRADAA